jgi:endonuclease/exonuclease/phosphatase family metal-dependent hydrolase
VRRRNRLGRVATVAGSLGLAAGAATTLARSVTHVPGLAPDTWVMVTAFTDYGALAYAVAVAALGTAALLVRRPARVAAVLVAVTLTAVHLSWILPRYVPDDRPAAGLEGLRVLAQNMLFGGADADQLVAAAREADVVVLTEITEPAARALDRAGIGASQGYQAGGAVPASGAAGTRVYSRFPLLGSRPLDPAGSHEHWVVTVDVPDVGPVTVVAVHPPRPVRGGAGWAAGQEHVRTLVPHERTIVAGDFNAVDSHPSLRRFRADGFRDSDELVGAGWQPTYPAQGHIPPLVAIDHVLVSPDLTATSFGTVQLAGTDHRGVTATVALRG